MKQNKKTLNIIMFCVIMIFTILIINVNVSCLYADIVVNGDFSTGNFSGYTYEEGMIINAYFTAQTVYGGAEYNDYGLTQDFVSNIAVSSIIVFSMNILRTNPETSYFVVYYSDLTYSNIDISGYYDALEKWVHISFTSSLTTGKYVKGFALLGANASVITLIDDIQCIYEYDEPTPTPIPTESSIVEPTISEFPEITLDIVTPHPKIIMPEPMEWTFVLLIIIIYIICCFGFGYWFWKIDSGMAYVGLLAGVFVATIICILIGLIPFWFIAITVIIMILLVLGRYTNTYQSIGEKINGSM